MLLILILAAAAAALIADDAPDHTEGGVLLGSVTAHGLGLSTATAASRLEMKLYRVGVDTFRLVADWFDGASQHPTQSVTLVGNADEDPELVLLDAAATFYAAKGLPEPLMAYRPA